MVDPERQRGQESEQLPEEGPAEQAFDETDSSGARDDAEESAGAADRDADSEASTGGGD